MSKKRNLFAGLICLLLAFVCLVACDGVTQSPETAAKQKAEADAQEVLGKLIWDDEDRTKITGSLFFATQNKNYPGVSISWTSSEEDIISNEGKVNRPESDDERNVLDGEDLYATVIITATVVCEYSWEANGTQTATTEPISKQFTFTVLAKPEGTDTGTIEDVKARAWNYIYVEQKVDKALVTNDSVKYNVLLNGVVTAKLNAEGATKGFMLHDGTDGIYVYGNNTNVEIGDYVEVIGGVYSYYGSLQVGSNVSVSKTNGKVTLPEYKVVTPQQWEDQNKGLGDDVIGHLGGDLYKVEGYLGYGYNSTTKDEFFITDAYTGEVAWIYYKSYTAEMKTQLESLVGEYVQVAGCGYDRDSRIVKNHLLWNGEVEKVEAPVVDDETKANVALTQITLKDTYDADFDLSDAGTWEVVSGTGVEIVEGVAKVTRADEDQVVVLKVTVTVGEAVVSKELTVTIKAIVKETPKHAGTKEDPYTVSDAVLVAGGLDADVPTEQVYAVGTIKEITDLSVSYGNATFVITDGVKDIIVFRAKYLNNEKFTAEDQIKVGDVVVIVGQLVNYKGNTLEFNSGCYIDSFVEDEPVVEDPYGCISIEEAIALGAAQEHNTYTEEKYYVKGTVTGFYNTTYGNFYLTDGTNQICVYGLYSADGTVRYDAMEVKPVDGDEIIVYGVLGQYSGNAQFKSAWLVEFVEDEPVVEDPYGCISIEEAIALGAAQEHNTYTEEKYYVKGTVTGFYNTTYGNFYLTDGTNQICVYGLYSADGTVRYDAMEVKPVDGDEIIVYGVLGQYSGNAQFKSAWLVEIVGGEEVPHEHEYVNGECACGEKDPNYVEPSTGEYTVAEALELADGTAVIIKGTVDAVEAWNDQYGNMNFTLKDATGTLYVFRVYTKVALGDIVTVEGTMGTYYETRQIAQGATITITGHDDSYDQVVEGTVTITFDDKAKMTSYSVDAQVWEENGIKVTNSKHESTQDVKDYANPARFYANTQLLVECEKAFTKVEFTTAGGKNFASNFTLEGATVTVNGTSCIIEFSEAVTSFTIEKLAAQIRVSSIEVYTE